MKWIKSNNGNGHGYHRFPTHGDLCKYVYDQQLNRDAVKETIVRLFPGRGKLLHEFNDHPDTTFEDICAILKEIDCAWNN